jgi:hypothetical protein
VFIVIDSAPSGAEHKQRKAVVLFLNPKTSEISILRSSMQAAPYRYSIECRACSRIELFAVGHLARWNRILITPAANVSTTNNSTNRWSLGAPEFTLKMNFILKKETHMLVPSTNSGLHHWLRTKPSKGVEKGK